ncbi:WecB/TagA/CpsF family glycosyltransferase [Leifsonia sp. NPDC056824]|uniref:WecB/TagA/CpsF family glycosyltransferase n=1 Tax=Leifsonia sp. NPDC056824 TaxID=3345953 RepID=UPI00369C6AC3
MTITLQRATIGGLRLDRADLNDAILRILDLVASGSGGIVVPSNVATSRYLRTVGFPRLEQETAFWPVDGVPLTWLLRIAGKGAFPRVAGTDLMNALIAHPGTRDLRIAVIGAASDEAERFYRVQGHANVRGGHLPVAETGSPVLIDAGDDFLGEYRPQIVFTCLGFPKQEHLMLSLHERHPEVVFIGAGAAAQINTGHFPRAPHLMRRLGLEWVWRMGQDPSRLVKRYLLQDLPWLVGMIPVAVIERVRSGLRPPPARAARRSRSAG